VPRPLLAGILALSSIGPLACSRDSSTSRPVAGRSWTTPPIEAADGGLVARRLPRILYRGGRFTRNPRIVTVTFTRDDPNLVARLEQFGDTITRSSWWREVVDSYCEKPDDCIGEGRPGPHLHLGDALPAAVRDRDVDDILEREAKAGRFGPLDGDSLLLVYLPRGVDLSDAYTPKYCVNGPRAFHRVLTVGEARIAYAVVARCGDEAEVTAAASHELLEATTNPDPSNRGFAFERSSDNYGFTIAGLEPVDPCGLLTMDGHWTVANGFTVQRAWSNRAAALGHDPCVPAHANRPYLALVPRTPTVRLTSAGATATIVLDAVADRPVSRWAASAFDVTGNHDNAEYVDLALDRTVIAAGESATLTITVKKIAPPKVDLVGVVSTLGVHSHMWPITVVMN
jgi:hypothetical protein